MPLPNPPQDINTLLGLPTADKIRAVLVSTLVRMKVRADLWPVGGAASSVLTDVSEMAGGFAENVLAAIKAGWLPTATKGWLQWVAFYFYGQNKQTATFATGPLLLTNSGGGVYNFAPFTASFASSITKKQYTNVDAIALGVGPSQQTINLQAREVGAASNAAPGEVDTLVTSMLGVTCTNLQPILGLDDQSDDSLRDQCWNSLGARSVRGPRTAYAYAIQIATNPLTGTPVNINRWTISVSSHTGQVQVWVAAPGGAPLSSDVTGVANSIEQVARPECVQVTTTGATNVNYAGPVTVWCRPQAGLTAATVAQAIAAALDSFFENYPISGLTADGFTGVHGSGVEGVVTGAFPGIFAVDLPQILPSPFAPGDLTLAPGQVAVNAIQITDINVRFASS